MSVMGTGAAAGVAQTALNAQQAARIRDRERNRRAVAVRDLRELLDSHVQAIDEGDQDGNPSQLHIDGQPSNQQPPPQVEPGNPEHPHERVDAVAADNPAPVRQAEKSDRLYRHVDLQA